MPTIPEKEFTDRGHLLMYEHFLNSIKRRLFLQHLCIILPNKYRSYSQRVGTSVPIISPDLEEDALTLPPVLQQLKKYLGASVLSAIVDVAGVYLSLNLLKMHYIWCVIVGFIMGTFVNFLISNKYVFSRQVAILAACIKHYFSSLTGLMINLAVVVICVEYINIAVMPSKIIALGIGFIFNFTAIKFYAFRDYSFR